MKLSRLILLASLLAARCAAAQDASCKAPETMAEIYRCEDIKLNLAEQALNASYQRLLKELDGSEAYEREARATLVKAQRHWVAFREQDCLARYTARGGGSLAPWYRVHCMLEHATARTRQLDDFRTD